MERFEITIVGGGIIGLSIARSLSKKFSKIVLLEQSQFLMNETSSRNSEVIHSGIYYEKNSLKKKFSIQGKEELYEYCRNNNVPHARVGKIIIGKLSQEDEMTELFQNGLLNGLDDIQILSRHDIKQKQQSLDADIGIWVPSTGIVDSHILGERFASEFESNGGLIIKKTRFKRAYFQNAKNVVEIENPDGTSYLFSTGIIINSGGLSAIDIDKKIEFLERKETISNFFVKGNYLSYSGRHDFKHLIYPMPNDLGLGIHSTININNELKFGPDTEIGSQDYKLKDGLVDKFYPLIKDWWPDIIKAKLSPSYCGLRPKILVNNELYKDFLFLFEKYSTCLVISLLGIESPGLTSSLQIGRFCEQQIKEFI